MKKWMARALLVAVGAALSLSVAALAAPILPEKQPVADEMKCLANGKRLRVEFGEMPLALARVGVSAANVQRNVRRKLGEAGFEFVDDPETPKLLISFRALVDSTVKGTTGFAIFFEVRQRVRVLRLGDDMDLTTATLLAYGIKKNRHVAKAAFDRLDYTIDQLVFFVEAATRHRDALKKRL
jgi:hypothetical protein